MTIIVHHLNNSRSQRILWLLEELGEPYDVRRYERDRKTMRAPAALRAVQKAIGGLMAGAAATDAFIAAMLAHSLIEPIDISLAFDDGETLRLDGLYTVSLDALSELPDAAVMGLFRAGHLQPAFALAGSLHHVALMARRRNARLTQIG